MASDPGLLMFDNEWLIRQAPGILGDFSPPAAFAAFSPRNHQAAAERKDGGKGTWNMISLGGSGSGLPWHTHGETWIATVYGRKAWFVYAPGDADSSRRGHPLHDASMWLEHTFPSLSAEDRPMHCVQHPGEVVYLPAGYAHLTVNLEDVIGAGAQSNMRAEDVKSALTPAAAKSDPEAQMYMAFYLQQKLAAKRGVGEMREETGSGEQSIRRGVKRGGAKKQQGEVIRLLQAAAEHHPAEIRAKLQLADIYARLGKHKLLASLLSSVEEALHVAQSEAKAVQQLVPVPEEGGAGAHPLLLAEAWYRLALVYHHHERAFESPHLLRAVGNQPARAYGHAGMRAGPTLGACSAVQCSAVQS